MTLDAGGNVGIGTNSPGDRLSISGGLTVDHDDASTGSLANGLRFGSAGSSGEGIASKRSAGGNQFGLDFYTASANRMSIDVNGNVGIGTNSPKKTLHNTGDYYGHGHIWLYAYEGDGQSGTALLQARDDSTTSQINLRFRTKNASSLTEAMTLTATGDAGIGTTSPGARLETNTGGGTRASLKCEHAGSNLIVRPVSAGGTATVIENTAIGGGAVLAVNPSGGNVGIGTTSPGALLDVRGDIKLGGTGQYFASSGEENLRIVRGIVNNNGTIQAGSGFTVTHGSTGNYTVTFTAGFSSLPAVTATLLISQARTATIGNVTSGSVNVLTWMASGTGAAVDTSFAFTAIGPR